MTIEHAQQGTDATDDTNLLTTPVDGESSAEHDAEEAAMQAGFKAVHGAEVDATSDDKTDNTNGGEGKNPPADGDAGADDATGASADAPAGQQPPSGEDDPEIPGLGKASEIRAQLNEAAELRKQMASVNGHIGHLKSLIQTAGKGKPITKESLSKVREEFGDEYAEALAADLNAAGIGGGAVADEETIARVAATQIAQAVEVTERKAEKKIVLRAHKDAAEFFEGGSQSAAFMQFITTLPAERQKQVLESWDSDVIVPVITDFKAQRDKAASQQARQTSRVARAIAPTQQRGAATTQPEVDPMEAGYQAVAGKRVAPGRMVRR